MPGSALAARIRTALLVAAFSCVIVLTLAPTFFPDGAAARFYASPSYFAAWMVFLLLAAAAAFLPPGPRAAPARRIWLHAPLALLGAMAAAALATQGGGDLELSPGEERPIAEIRSLAGLKGGEGSVKLESFELIPYRDGKEIKSYRSVLLLSRAGKQTRSVVEVNRPLRLDGLSLSQKAWSVGLRETSASVEGRVFSFNKSARIILSDRRVLEIGVLGWKDGLVYRWSLASAEGSTLDEGSLTAKDPPSALIPYGFGIEREDYAFRSLLEARRGPLGLPLALTAAAALLALAWGLWSPGRTPPSGARP